MIVRPGFWGECKPIFRARACHVRSSRICADIACNPDHELQYSQLRKRVLKRVLVCRAVLGIEYYVVGSVSSSRSAISCM